MPKSKICSYIFTSGENCERNTITSRSKYCKTHKINCEHGRQKHHCKDCGGSGICEHGKRKYHCKDCGGAGICEHGKQKHHCKDCKGSGICKHGKNKHYCKDYRGAGICEHGKNKHYCKDCRSAGICEHGKQKNYCNDCKPKKPNQKNILEPESWILPPPITPLSSPQIKIEPTV